MCNAHNGKFLDSRRIYWFSVSVISHLVMSSIAPVKAVLTYFMVDFQINFGYQFCIYFVLAMASSAFAMLVSASVTDVKLAPDFLLLVTSPQIMFTGFFIAITLIPACLRQGLNNDPAQSIMVFFIAKPHIESPCVL